jgi:hypothetical protein
MVRTRGHAEIAESQRSVKGDCVGVGGGLSPLRTGGCVGRRLKKGTKRKREREVEREGGERLRKERERKRLRQERERRGERGGGEKREAAIMAEAATCANQSLLQSGEC